MVKDVQVVCWRENLLNLNRKAAKTGWGTGALYVCEKICLYLTQKQ